MMGRETVRIFATVAVLAAAPVSANPRSEALRARATDELYNMNRDRAAALFREAIAADPNDAAAYRGLAGTLWLNIAFSRGATTVDNYLGQISRDDVRLPPPPPDVAAEFRQSINRALELARKRLAANPRDADAHYQLGAAVGLRASYTATVEGSVRAAFSAAREAYNAHERVLELNPARRDAGLIVGTYRYIIAALALPLRLIAYAAGFGGGREKGLTLVEGASNYDGDNQADARLALVLLYNREERYDEAMKQLTVLRQKYPLNRLLWLESGSTSLRAGKAAEADALLSEGIARLATDHRPRMFGEESLWYYKRGAARAALGRSREAEQDLRKSVSSEGRNWVHGRARLELGKLALKAGNRPAAQSELREAIRLCNADNDKPSADAARKLIR